MEGMGETCPFLNIFDFQMMRGSRGDISVL